MSSPYVTVTGCPALTPRVLSHNIRFRRTFSYLFTQTLLERKLRRGELKGGEGMAKAEPIMKGAKQVATKTGKMIVKGKGGLWKPDHFGRITKAK